MQSAMQSKIVVDFVSQIIKDIYASAKGAVNHSYAKWNNEKNISKLVAKIKNYERVKTIWQRDKEVRISDFYYPSKVVFADKSGEITDVGSLRDMPQGKSFVIEGTVGQGKSIFLRYLCIQELGMGSSNRIPVFFEFRKLDATLDIKSAVFNSFTNLGFDIDDYLFDFYAKSGRVVFLLDGFDEIDESYVRKTINQLEDWVERYPQAQFIITSRPNADIGNSRYFTVARLAELKRSDFKPFMIKIGVKAKEVQNILDAIEKSGREISGLLQTPLLLTLLVLVYQSEQDIPRELPEFFEKLFSTVFTRHDRSKPGFIRKHRSGLNESRFETLFEAFCFYVLRNSFSVVLSKERFSVAFNQALKFIEEKCDEDNYKYDLVRSVCLMQEDGYDVVFIHKSILDYFSAAFIRHRHDSQASLFYKFFLEKNCPYQVYSGWAQTLKFLAKIDRYRYLLYYFIPSIELVLNKFGIKNVDVSDEQLQNVFDYIFKNAKAFYANVNCKFSLNGIHYGVDLHIYQKIELSCLSSVFDACLSPVDTLEELGRAFSCKPIEKEDGTYVVGLYDVMCSEAVRVKCNEAIKSALQSMLDKHAKALSYVENENSKTRLILEGFDDCAVN